MRPRSSGDGSEEISVRMPGKQQPKSVSDIARELWELAQGYAKQETIDPFRVACRCLGFGLGGSIMISVGALLLSLGLLRLLQTIDVFDGFWSWAPYLIVMVLLGIVTALIGRSIAASFEPPPPTGGSTTPTQLPVEVR